MLKCFCNRCRKEIPIYYGEPFMTGYVSVNFREGFDGDLLDNNPFENSHFCLDCIVEIQEFVINKENQGGQEI